jgi:hypothetical protein
MSHFTVLLFPSVKSQAWIRSFHDSRQLETQFAYGLCQKCLGEAALISCAHSVIENAVKLFFFLKHN